mgnify:CR=1 FL=1
MDKNKASSGFTLSQPLSLGILSFILHALSVNPEAERVTLQTRTLIGLMGREVPVSEYSKLTGELFRASMELQNLIVIIGPDMYTHSGVPEAANVIKNITYDDSEIKLTIELNRDAELFDSFVDFAIATEEMYEEQDLPMSMLS